MSNLPYLTRQNKKDEIVRRLQNGADVNEKDSSKHTALYYAGWDNRTEIVEILLQNNKINVNLQDNYGWSALHTACANNRCEIVLLMLQDARLDFNLADYRGWSPLMYACCLGYTRIVKLLLSSCRYVDVHNKSTKDSLDYYSIESGSTALDIAKQIDIADVVQLLQQYQNNPKETRKTLRNKLDLKGKKYKNI